MGMSAALDLPLLGTQYEFLARLGMADRVDGPVNPERQELSPERAAEKVKGFAMHLGADLVRIGPLNPAYVYTNIGKTWHDPARSFGRSIEVPHKHAISVAVGIDPDMIGAGPVLPEVVEIMRVYVQLATIAGHSRGVHPRARLSGPGQRDAQLSGALRAYRHRCRDGGVGPAWAHDHTGTGERAQAGHHHHRSAPGLRSAAGRGVEEFCKTA